MRMREREDPQIHIKREERNLGERVGKVYAEGRIERKENQLPLKKDKKIKTKKH